MSSWLVLSNWRHCNSEGFCFILVKKLHCSNRNRMDQVLVVENCFQTQVDLKFWTNESFVLEDDPQKVYWCPRLFMNVKNDWNKVLVPKLVHKYQKWPKRCVLILNFSQSKPFVRARFQCAQSTQMVLVYILHLNNMLCFTCWWALLATCIPVHCLSLSPARFWSICVSAGMPENARSL